MSKSKTKTARPTDHRSTGGSLAARRIVSLHVLVVGLPLAMSNISIFGATNPVSWTYDQFDLIKSRASVGDSGRGTRHVGGIGVSQRSGSSGITGPWRPPASSWYGRSCRGHSRPTSARRSWAPTSATRALSRSSPTSGLPRSHASTRRDRSRRGVARSAVYAASFAAAYGVVQYAGLDPLNWVNMGFNTRMAFATLGNPDLLGGYLALMLPIALGVALSEREDRRQVRAPRAYSRDRRRACRLVRSRGVDRGVRGARGGDRDGRTVGLSSRAVGSRIVVRHRGGRCRGRGSHDGEPSPPADINLSERVASAVRGEGSVETGS